MDGRNQARGRANTAAAAAGLAALALIVTAPTAAARAQAGAGAETGAPANDPRKAPQSQLTMQQASAQDARELRALKRGPREQTFLSKMMDHHQSGIEMAQLALRKSQSPALQAEARRIVREQGAEIEQMRRHLASSHRQRRTARPDPRMQPAMEMLERLSGAEFDRAFAREMAMHHQGAIDMSLAVIEGGVPHRAVKSLAGKIVRGNRQSQKALARAAGRPA